MRVVINVLMYDDDCVLHQLVTWLLLTCFEKFAVHMRKLLVLTWLLPVFPGLPHAVLAVDEYILLLLEVPRFLPC